MNESKPLQSPTDVSRKASKTDDVALHENERAVYRSFIESIMYLATKTRPSISVTGSMLASHLHRPTKRKLNAAKRVLQYLRGTSRMEILMNPGNSTHLSVYVDASRETKRRGIEEVVVG